MRMTEKIKRLFNTGFFHIFCGSVINKVLNFVSGIILVRVISKSEYGIFTYAWNILSFILLFSGFGMSSGALQVCNEVFSDKKKMLSFYKHSVKFGVIFDFVLSFIILMIATLIPMPINGSNRLLLFMMFLPLILFLSNMQSIYLRIMRDNTHYAYYSMINVVLVGSMTIIGAYFFEAKGMVVGKYIAYAISVAVALIWFKTPKSFWARNSLSKSEKYDLYKISGISMLNSGLSELLYLIDVFIVGLVMIDELSVATYKVATQIPTALSFIPLSVVTYIYPYFAEHRNQKQWCLKRYYQTMFAIGLLNAVLSVSLIIFAPAIIKFVFGEQYMDALVPFRILSLSYFFSGTFRVIAGNLLVTQRRLKFNTMIAVSSGILNVIFDYLFILILGITGAALATISIVILTSIIDVGYLIYILKSGKN